MTALGNKQIMADNIAYYMRIKGIDRNQLCEDLDFKYSTVSEWLSANKYPRIDSIEKMANYFGISKSKLIEKCDHSNPTTETPINSSAPTIESYLNSFKSPAERKAAKEIIEILPQLSLNGLMRVYQYVVDSQYVPGCLKSDLESIDDGLTLIAARGGESKLVELNKREGAGSIFDAPDYKGGRK